MLLHKLLLQDSKVIALKYHAPHIQAILFASTNSRKTLSATMRKGVFKLFPFIVKKVLFSPKTLKHMWETAFYSNKYQDAVGAEILVLSVSKKVRNQGIGKKLMLHLKKELKKRNVKELRVSTLEQNNAANRFYKATGGIYTYAITIYGRKWNVYHYKLTT